MVNSFGRFFGVSQHRIDTTSLPLAGHMWPEADPHSSLILSIVDGYMKQMGGA